MLNSVDTGDLALSGSLIPPNERHGQADGRLDLPPGTTVFSADSHIDLSEDIFFERFPDHLKDRVPRVWFENGIWNIGHGGSSYLPPEFVAPLSQYDLLPGASTGGLAARMKDNDDEGVDRELNFPNNMLVLLGLPDHEIRERCFRIYNERLAELQEAAPGRFYGVGFINWWDPAGARRTLDELKKLGLRTFQLPLNPLTDRNGNVIDWGSKAMTPVWDEIAASGLPVSHHIGESPKHCEHNPLAVGLLHNMAGFREMFAKYVFGGILDRHPSLKVGWFEAGINWVASVLQDAVHVDMSIRHIFNWKLHHEIGHYWREHMSASFMIDPIGLELVDRIGIDNIMWSSDYRHSEGTFGFTKNAIRSVVDGVGDEAAPAVLGGNVTRFLGLGLG